MKRRMPSLLHLLSNHLWPRGCSMFSVVHLCLISLVYSYSSEIIDRCFQGCALTRHQFHQQATSHTESIRHCWLCVILCLKTEGLVKKQEWLRWRCSWLGTVTNAITNQTHTLYFTIQTQIQAQTHIQDIHVLKCHIMPPCVWPLIKCVFHFPPDQFLFMHKKYIYTHIHTHTK